jgi:hypothetical protein
MASLDLPRSQRHEKTKGHKLARVLTRCANDVRKFNVQEASCFPTLSISTFKNIKRSQPCTDPRYHKSQVTRDTLLDTQSSKYLDLLYALCSSLRRKPTPRKNVDRGFLISICGYYYAEHGSQICTELDGVAL